ncbi:hypothetical protein [Nodularia chucula]
MPKASAMGLFLWEWLFSSRGVILGNAGDYAAAALVIGHCPLPPLPKY